MSFFARQRVRKTKIRVLEILVQIREKSIFLALSLVLTTSVSDATPTGDRSYCNGEHALTAGTRQLSSWFSALESRIQSKPDYVPIVNELRATLKNKQSVVCHFVVQNDGLIESVSVSQSGITTDLIARTLKLIESSAPVAVPPNNLPQTHGIRIVFLKDNGSLEMKTSLGNSDNTRIGENK